MEPLFFSWSVDCNGVHKWFKIVWSGKEIVSDSIDLLESYLWHIGCGQYEAKEWLSVYFGCEVPGYQTINQGGASYSPRWLALSTSAKREVETNGEYENYQSILFGGFSVIGNSLSFCVKDILKGKVKEEDVELIRCSFMPPKNYRFFRKHTVGRYIRVYWCDNKRRAIRIARRLYKRGKLQFTGGHYLQETWGGELKLTERGKMIIARSVPKDQLETCHG